MSGANTLELFEEIDEHIKKQIIFFVKKKSEIMCFLC